MESRTELLGVHKRVAEPGFSLAKPIIKRSLVKKTYCWAFACGIISCGGLMQVELGSCVQEKLLGEPTHPGPKFYALNPCTLVSIWNY